MYDRLTQIAERIAHSKIVENYIVKVKSGYLYDLRAEIHPLLDEAFSLFPIFEKIPTDFISYPANLIEKFDMLSTVLTRDMVFDLADDYRVEKIFYDKLMYAFQFPIVPPEGIFTIKTRKKEITFTTTWYSRYALGLNEAHGLGYWGKGTKVAVVDTGCSRFHEQLRGIEHKSAMKGQYTDFNGHGCVSPDTIVITNNPGIIKISDLYEKISINEIQNKEGFSKIPNKNIYTFSIQNNQIKPDRIVALHKIPINNEVIEITTLWNKKILLTPWHPTPVVRNNKIEWVRADQIKIGDYIPHNFKTLSFGEYQKVKGKLIDEDFAWLIGYTIGDGTFNVSNKNFDITTLSDEKQNLLEKASVIAREKGFKTTIKDSILYIHNHFASFMSGLDIVVGTNGKKGSAKRYKKKVPDIIMKSPPSVRSAFVAGLFDAEGWVWEPDYCKSKKQKGFTVKIVNFSEELCKGIVDILDSLGIPSNYKLQYKGNERESNMYAVEINQGIIIERFYEIVGKYVKSFKKEVLKKIIAYLKKQSRMKHEILPYNNEIIGIKVKKIKRISYNGYFYDFTTENNNNYYASGKFVHNTWCATCIAGYEGIDEAMSRITGSTIRALGMAPEANLICIKSLGYGVGVGKTSDIVKGIEMSVNSNIDIISMSLGGDAKEKKPDDDPYYDVMNKVVSYGIIPVVAAGNSGSSPNTISSPGDLPQVLTVGAYNPMTGEMADFSSRGPTNFGEVKPDCVAPGVNVYSGTQGICDKAEDNRMTGYSPLSGTSMSTPAVSGALAIYNQIFIDKLGRRLTIDEVKHMLEVTATSEKSNDYGWGVPTFERFRYYLGTEYGVEL